jgi:hypothetical protein
VASSRSSVGSTANSIRASLPAARPGIGTERLVGE